MIRNQSDQRKTLFSRSNPPTTRDQAHARTEELHQSISQIEAQLDHADPDDWPNDAEYQTWRRGATSALGYKRCELQYLISWLEGGDERLVAERSQRAASGTSLTAIARGIRAKAETLAADIRKDYRVVYSPVSLPGSLAAAQDRLLQLTTIHVRLMGAYTEVAEAWTAHPLRRGDLPGVKAPLSRILSELEQERAFLRQFTRVHQVPVVSCREIMSSALRRAVAEGFALLPHEQDAFDQMCARNKEEVPS